MAGIHIGSKKTVKISIIFEGLSRYSLFLNRSEALDVVIVGGEGQMQH
mgnify:CR=1 FL=1